MPASFSHFSRVSWEFHLHGYCKLKGAVSRNRQKLYHRDFWHQLCLCRFLAAILVSLGKAVNTFIFSDSGLNLLNGINISFIFDSMRVKTSKILSTQMISEIPVLKIKNAESCSCFLLFLLLAYNDYWEDNILSPLVYIYYIYKTTFFFSFRPSVIHRVHLGPTVGSISANQWPSKLQQLMPSTSVLVLFFVTLSNQDISSC